MSRACGSPRRSRLASLSSGCLLHGDGTKLSLLSLLHWRRPRVQLKQPGLVRGGAHLQAWAAQARSMRRTMRRTARDHYRYMPLSTLSPMTLSARAGARVPILYPLRAGSARGRTHSSFVWRARACCRLRTSSRPPWTSSSPSCATCRCEAPARRAAPTAPCAPAAPCALEPHAARARPAGGRQSAALVGTGRARSLRELVLVSSPCQCDDCYAA